MRKKIVAGNWKMNKSIEEGLNLASEIVAIANDEINDEIILVICPPFVHLTGVKRLVEESSNVFLGAQNCYDKELGAYTGEVSASMLKSIGTDFVILGHSERREHFHESNEMLAKKVDIVLANGMKPIFCCGESLEIRESGAYIDFVKSQLTKSLFHLSIEYFSEIIIAYEPIWAIGTGKTASSKQAQEMHAELRMHIASKYGKQIADECSILYGGSAKPANAPELFACPDVDGGLIGGASLKSRDFIDIAKSF